MVQREIEAIKKNIVENFLFCRFAKKECIKWVRVVEKGRSTWVGAEIDER